MAESSGTIDIKLRRIDRIYRPGDILEGSIVVTGYKPWAYNSIHLSSTGTILCSSPNKSLLVNDIANNTKHIILEHSIQVASSGKVPEGSLELPFQFPIQPVPGMKLYDSYHGVFISIIYVINVVCDRGLMKKNYTKEVEFIVEIPPNPSEVQKFVKAAEPVKFRITPDSLENVPSKILSTIPKFVLAGKIHRTICSITNPLTGDLLIENSEAPIRTIDLQLIRVETVYDPSPAANHRREATEVQNIQIADGNISRNFRLPIYMIFPKIFSCPSLNTNLFRIDFELNIILVYGEGYMITENFPLTLYRD